MAYLLGNKLTLARLLLLLGGLSACSSSGEQGDTEAMGAGEKLTVLEGNEAAEVDEGNEADLSNGTAEQAEVANPAQGDGLASEAESEEDLLGEGADSSLAGTEEGVGNEAAVVAEEPTGNSSLEELADPADLMVDPAPAGGLNTVDTPEENIATIAEKAAEEAGIPLEVPVNPAQPAEVAQNQSGVDPSSAANPSPVNVAAAPAEASAATPEAVAPEVSVSSGELAAQLSTVKWVGYRFEENKSLLTIEILNTLPTDYEVFSALDRRREAGYLFRFYQSRLSRKMRYALDSSEFCSPISAISMYESEDGSYVDVFVKHTPRFQELAAQGQLIEGVPGGELGRGSLRLMFPIPTCEEGPASSKVVVRERAQSLVVGMATPLAKRTVADTSGRPKVGLARIKAKSATSAISIADKIKQRQSSKVDKRGLPESFDRSLVLRSTLPRSTLRIVRSTMMGVANDDIAAEEGQEQVPEVPEAEMEAEVPLAAPVVDESVPLPTEVSGQETPDPVGGKSFTGKAVVLDFYDAPLSLVLNSLKEQTGHTYIYTEAVGQTRVTINFRNVPWDEALEAILQTYGFASARIGESIVRIDQLEKIAETKKVRDKAEKATSTQVLVFPLNHAKAEELEPRITAILKDDDAKTTVDKRTNKIIIEASKRTIAKVKEIIKRLDTETPQVEIISRIVEVRKSFSNIFGISWLNNLNFDPGRALGFGTLNFPNSLTSNFAVDPGVTGDATAGAARFRFGSLNKFIDLDLLLKMEEKKGTTNILQSNRILVLDNENAIIKQGLKRENIQATAAQVPGIGGVVAPPPTPEAFLLLDVTPQVSGSSAVRLKLKITSDSFLDPANAPNQTTSKKELVTSMVRGSGETGVIGGIYDTKKAVSLRGVPFLSDIPILGALFRRSTTEEEQSELLIMVTPTIMPTESPGGEEEMAALKNPLEWKEGSTISQKDNPGSPVTGKL